MRLQFLLLIAILPGAGCLSSSTESSSDDNGVVTHMPVSDDQDQAVGDVDGGTTTDDDGESGKEPSIAELRRAFKLDDREFAMKQGGKIRAINLQNTNVTDLSPLKGLKLVSLDLLGTRVKDLSPLKGMPLKELYAEKTQVSDLTPLAGMPLTKLHLGETPVRDLKPLAGMTLEELNLNGAEIESLDGVDDIHIGTLWVPHTKVKSLIPLAASSLISLDIEDTPVDSLAALNRMTSLKRLNIVDSAVADVSPLKNLELERLLFTPGKVKRGLEYIRKMPTMRELGVDFDHRLPPAQFWPLYDAGKLSETAQPAGATPSP